MSLIETYQVHARNGSIVSIPHKVQDAMRIAKARHHAALQARLAPLEARSARLAALDLGYRGKPPADLVSAMTDLLEFEHDLPRGSILSGSRIWVVARARFRVIARLRALKFSTPGIGAAIGRDHSSVLSALKRHAELESSGA